MVFDQRAPRRRPSKAHSCLLACRLGCMPIGLHESELTRDGSTSEKVLFRKVSCRSKRELAQPTDQTMDKKMKPAGKNKTEPDGSIWKAEKGPNLNEAKTKTSPAPPRKRKRKLSQRRPASPRQKSRTGSPSSHRTMLSSRNMIPCELP